MTESHSDLPAWAPLGSGLLPVSAIIVWRAEGGWHAGRVLTNTEDGGVTTLPPWDEEFLDSPPRPEEGLWNYLADRLEEGRGGNGYTYELDGFEAATIEDARVLTTARAAEATVASHGPMGEIAGTIITEGTDEMWAVMPFVLLIDDRGHDALVATKTNEDPDSLRVGTVDGAEVTPIPFESVEHWQQAGAASWPLQRSRQYRVRWGRQEAAFAIEEDGSFGDLQLPPPATS